MAGLLDIYLRDHLAALVGGIELARRFCAQPANAEYAPPVHEWLGACREDRAALVAVMGALRVAPSRFKNGASWLAEKVGRLKPNGRVVAYSPLSRVVELEGLLALNVIRRRLWSALAGATTHPALTAARPWEREARAAAAAEALASLHQRAAQAAL